MGNRGSTNRGAQQAAQVVNPTAIVKPNPAAIVKPFYDSLNKPATKTVRANVESVAIDSWQSFSGETVFKTRDAFIEQVIGFGKGIPDLSWDVKEVIVSAKGDKVIVRSEASGTPSPNLMGVPNPDNNKFHIMAIDIHTIKDGKLVTAHHVEDWATAFKQLKGDFTASLAANDVNLNEGEGHGEDLQARAEAIVKNFYDSLTSPATKDVENNVKGATHPNWISFNNEKIYKDRDAFIGQVKGFGKLIPDLKWDVKEIIPSADGTKIIVRSEASGIPVLPLFGVENPEGKKFSIMAIDLHTVQGGKLVRVHHVEDWKTALAQLK